MTRAGRPPGALPTSCRSSGCKPEKRDGQRLHDPSPVVPTSGRARLEPRATAAEAGAGARSAPPGSAGRPVGRRPVPSACPRLSQEFQLPLALGPVRQSAYEFVAACRKPAAAEYLSGRQLIQQLIERHHQFTKDELPVLDLGGLSAAVGLAGQMFQDLTLRVVELCILQPLPSRSSGGVR